MKPIDLHGRRALVTGGSYGIGLSIADVLCEAGCAVAITGRDDRKLGEAKERLAQRHPGCSVMAVRSDASIVSEIRNMVAEVQEHYGRLDILVNNAGTNRLNDAVDVTEEEWDRIMNVNLKGLFFCSQEAGKLMIAQGGGKIINIASQMGLVGLQQRAVYCASKGGVVQLTKVLAIEWAPSNIQVNAIAPTFIETPLTQGMLAEPEFRAEMLRRIPMNRFAQPRHVADAVLYLASELSDFVTGHTLPVDGGWVAW